MDLHERHGERLGFLYALPFLVKAMALTPLVTFIPAYYSGEYGLPLALVGTILFVTRLTDIVTDPLIGILSDRTRSRFGRRKPWIVAGIPLLMLSIWMVFAPPVEVTPTYAFVWIALVYLGFTLVDIPYKAWGAELSQSYSGRTSIVGWREGFGIASSMMTLAVIFALPKLGYDGNTSAMWFLGTIFVIALPLLFAITLTVVPEPPVDEIPKETVNWREAAAVIVGNKPFMFLLGGLTVLIAGGIIGASLHLIVMEKVFNARHLFPIILALENVASLLAIPLWIRVAKRIGKHRTMAVATMWMAVWSFPIPLLGAGDAYLYAACIVIRGIAGGAFAVLVGSMIADVVDLDTLRTGRSRTSLYFALTGMLTKGGIAIGALIGTAIPSFFGFETANLENTPTAIFALLATYAWIPMVIMGSSSPFFWFYPLTEEVQKDLRRQIDAAKAERQSSSSSSGEVRDSAA